VKVRWRPEVLEEIAEAIEYLEQQRPGTGARFRGEIDAAIARLQAFPHLARVRHRDVRLAVLRSFDYLIAYRMRDDEIRILAVLHGSRPPLTLERPGQRRVV